MNINNNLQFFVLLFLKIKGYYLNPQFQCGEHNEDDHEKKLKIRNGVRNVIERLERDIHRQIKPTNQVSCIV